MYNFFIIILSCVNNLVLLIVSGMFSLFIIQVLEKLDMEVFYFGVFLELSTLEIFLLGISNMQ